MSSRLICLTDRIVSKSIVRVAVSGKQVTSAQLNMDVCISIH